MDHKGTVTRRTDRLILRRFVMEDAGAMYKNWASEDAVTQFLTWPTHESADVTRAVLADWIRGYERADFYQWAIELKELGQVVGSISVTAQRCCAISSTRWAFGASPPSTLWATPNPAGSCKSWACATRARCAGPAAATGA